MEERLVMEMQRENKNKHQDEDYMLKLDKVIHTDKTNYEVYFELWDGAGADEETYVFDTYSEAKDYFELNGG